MDNLLHDYIMTLLSLCLYNIIIISFCALVLINFENIIKVQFNIVRLILRYKYRFCHQIPMDRIVGSHYRLRRRIGAGSFGEIYSAENTRSRRRVAVKLESVRTRVPQLSYESKLYAIFSGGTGIPRLHWYGTEDSHNIMVIDLLGKSLEDLFVYCHHKLSLKTVLMLVDQMISCVEFIHNKNFIHRDIKPDNFVMGLGSNSTQVFIIDYGLSKKYRDQHTHVHIPFVEGKSLTGTARYASVGALKGAEQSRRDDMESLGFVWLYLLRGSLPWMGLNGRDQKQKYDRIRDVKAKTSFEDLCQGFPEEFVKYFHDVRNLKFTEKPRYSEYRQMFRDLFMREGFVYDYKYDWCRDSPRPVPPKPMAGLPPKPTEVTNLGKPQVSSQFPNKAVQLTLPENNGPIADNGMPGSTLVNVRSEPVLTTDDKRGANQDPKSARRRREEEQQISNQQTASRLRQNNTTAARAPPSSALVGKRGERSGEQQDNQDRNERLNSARRDSTGSRTRTTDKAPDTARRTRTGATEGYKPPQSALAGGRRAAGGGIGGGESGLRTSARRNLAPTPRQVGPTKRKAGAGQPDNSIRRTLMPHWMEESKPKRTTTHTNKRSIYHI
ncbi:CK1 family protein kinase [Tritrichomonas foetus]|uniref:non-specific serine/threonine protein kinase n=1 Tax=Tritrichomonas foetus TaxID=1144522 RepID=A0A1J4JXU2_9EUKA|nr:CK1 family protein kinase [Tritrichomonas foetus]|eukprot:OHT02334.1 CK1 family protein kinase [Tritrichomonas foetus]